MDTAEVISASSTTHGKNATKYILIKTVCRCPHELVALEKEKLSGEDADERKICLIAVELGALSRTDLQSVCFQPS